MNDMNIVIVGHVDHGKSTIIGRLLADTKSLPQGKMEQVKENCRRNSKPFEYAFLLDALKDEQSQGITIDASRCFFKTANRRYMILDAPGHIEFLKNMITGAAKAQAALLVIDAEEGIKENTKRHAYMLSLLGVKQVAVLINKMDLVQYSQSSFENIVNEFQAFLEKIDLHVNEFIPISGANGDNLVFLSPKMVWYKANTTIEALENFKEELPLDEKPFRMFVQDIYKFTLNNDNRRIVAGTVETGTLQTGDRVVFFPSGKTSTVKTFEVFNDVMKNKVYPSEAIGFTLAEQIYIKRGEMVVKQGEQAPFTTNCFKANLFWLGKKRLKEGNKYFLKIGTLKTEVVVDEIINVMDSSTLENAKKSIVEHNEVATCIFKTVKPVSFDLYSDLYYTGRFVLVDGYNIAGGGLIIESIKTENQSNINSVVKREYNWEKSTISFEERSERYGQKATLVLITGAKKHDKKTIAKQLENNLFQKGKFVYYLGIGSVIHGLNYDIENERPSKEHLRRLAEVSNILLNAGVILIVSVSDLTKNDLELFKTICNNGQIVTVFLGNENEIAGTDYDLNIYSNDNQEMSVLNMEHFLKENGIIFSLKHNMGSRK